MKPTDVADHRPNPRNPDPSNDQPRIVLPRRTGGGFFPGWGPKMFAIAFALASPVPFQSGAFAETCTDRPATVLSSPEVEYPAALRHLELSGKTAVQVNIGADGSLLEADIAESSGNAFFDREALRVVRGSRYAPAVSECLPAAGSYIVEVDFNQDGTNE